MHTVSGWSVGQEEKVEVEVEMVEEMVSKSRRLEELTRVIFVDSQESNHSQLDQLQLSNCCYQESDSDSEVKFKSCAASSDR